MTRQVAESSPHFKNGRRISVDPIQCVFMTINPFLNRFKVYQRWRTNTEIHNNSNISGGKSALRFRWHRSAKLTQVVQ